MNVVELIITKRDGNPVEPHDIRRLVDDYTAGKIPDYQMSAFLMASFLRGMNDAEAGALADAMIRSGDILDLSATPGRKVDKHSTGGVGDKISLILAPLVASCGVPVPMISGRGLGHSGGTLDKLESIPGFNTSLSIDQYKQQLEKLGVVMIGQTDEIAPADKKLYALRDVTGTVEFIPFIAASIMSKKIAEGIDALVLDVKCGNGAFMKSETDARRLAETLAAVGKRFDKDVVALLTDMNAPIGYGIGNWPEVLECLDCLQGATVPDTMELVYALAAEMLVLGGAYTSLTEAAAAARASVASGSAMEKLSELVAEQGGDVRLVESPRPRKGFEPAMEVLAPPSWEGFVAGIDALALGYLSVDLGAGRRQKEDLVDPLAGIVLLKKVGDPVQPGEPVARLYTKRHDELRIHEGTVHNAFSLSATPPAVSGRIIDRLESGVWDSGAH